jgi:hypothetical protein
MLFAFANAHKDHLPLLKAESSAVRQALRPLWSTGRLTLHREESATLEEVFHALNDFAERVVAFHFAGHADAGLLQFEEGAATAGPFGDLLASEPNLRLVFLNGCATQAQVAALWDAGVPAVIATSVPVRDDRAKEFAAAFYAAFGKGVSLSTSFSRARDLLGAKYGGASQTVEFFRGVRKVSHSHDNEFPWGLWMRPDHEAELLEWKLGDAEPPRSLTELPSDFKTSDAVDRIELRSVRVPDRRGVTIRLETAHYMWWKGLGIGEPGPHIEGEGEGYIGRHVVEPHDPVRIYFHKAKKLGFKRPVGHVTLDLTPWDGHELIFRWMQD